MTDVADMLRILSAGVAALVAVPLALRVVRSPVLHLRVLCLLLLVHSVQAVVNAFANFGEPPSHNLPFLVIGVTGAAVALLAWKKYDRELSRIILSRAEKGT